MSIIQNITFLRKAETGNLPGEFKNAVDSIFAVADFGNQDTYPELFDPKEQADIAELVAKIKAFSSPSTGKKQNDPTPVTKPKSTAKAGNKARTTIKKAKSVRKQGRVIKKASAVPKVEATQKAKAMPKVTAKTVAKPKPSKSIEPAKPIIRTQVETPEHKQIKRFLAIRRHETIQLAMTAYKSLQKDIAERKIRAASPQAGLIRAIQVAYYKYIVGETNNLVLNEKVLKEANDFVGSQKPYETVALVKRFIGWTGQGKNEKQISDYIKDAEKAVNAAHQNDPYYDELKSIIKVLKATKAGDTVIADAVGLSGLRANTIKVRK